jgi:hypothetical protein
MASILRVDTLTDASSNNSVALETVSQGSLKAWIAVNQDGTMAILDSFNIASISDDGTGKTDATYTSNMSSANYSNSVTAGNSNNKRAHFFEPSTTQQQIEVHQVSANSTDTDSTYVCGKVAGDLA